MEWPDYLKPYRKQAEQVLSEGAICDIEFSGSTYQIEVKDLIAKQAFWTFIQLDTRGQIKDCFCSCEESESAGGCIHLAAAYLRIYQEPSSPLHQRFERSLWNRLCRLYSERIGYDPAVLLRRMEKGAYHCYSTGGKLVFFVKAVKSQARSRLKELIENPRQETEETSIKFSNLSQEELTLWREGKPGNQLKYELSFWNDVAKWLFLMEDKGERYKISYEYSPNRIPNHIFITFPELETGFYISEANLPLIIPALAFVESPLKVHNAPQETISSIRYDRESGVLKIDFKENRFEAKSLARSGISLNGWLFVPDEGFYLQDKNSLLRQSELKGPQISELFNDYLAAVKAFLEGTKIYEDPAPVSYSIAFDADWNLHISCYLFNPGDLTQGNSRCFGDWAYLDDEGFYKIEKIQFNEIEKKVPADQVADFIHQHRIWLNTQEGFQTHVAGLEAQISYLLTDDDHLSFDKRLLTDESIKTREFGPWIYVSGHGFYAKVNAGLSFPLKPGVSLSKEQIPLFIRMNKEELQLVPNFFAKGSPIIKTGLNIDYEKEDTVFIKPVYDIDPHYQGRKIRFYDDYIHIEDEGFFEIPIDQRLPERFRYPSIVEKRESGPFPNF